uniref:Uncharacterized protein n=1 Tax=Panagrolaimus sp. JU765 TaxID=591449 RepID=A0AC34PUH7_9BILA
MTAEQRGSECPIQEAETCFKEIFDRMPICQYSELTFKCNQFKSLDECFRKSSIICPPAIIGRIATTTHRRKLISCAKQTNKNYRNAPTRKKVASSILRNHPPTELQFISLFGYLQSQCSIKLVENCTNIEFKQMIGGCEADIKHRSGLTNSDYDRHRLLKIKLDTSSQLLQLAETEREDECLIVRSALTDIFKIHEKYCFNTIITRCLCERMNFEYFCGIQCANLDSTELPFARRISWDDFKGRLVANTSPTFPFNYLLLLLIFQGLTQP